MISAKKPRQTVNPEKELRFTRARQAVPFWALATLFACASAWLFIAASDYLNPLENRERVMESPWWGLIPIVPSLFCVWVAVHLTQHAFVILTPLGIELFPLWFPKKNLQVIYWAEVSHAEVGDSLRELVVHLGEDGGSKIFVSLAPIRKDRRPLLQRAVEGRMAAATEGARDQG